MVALHARANENNTSYEEEKSKLVTVAPGMERREYRRKSNVIRRGDDSNLEGEESEGEVRDTSMASEDEKMSQSNKNNVDVEDEDFPGDSNIPDTSDSEAFQSTINFSQLPRDEIPTRVSHVRTGRESSLQVEDVQGHSPVHPPQPERPRIEDIPGSTLREERERHDSVHSDTIEHVGVQIQHPRLVLASAEQLQEYYNAERTVLEQTTKKQTLWARYLRVRKEKEQLAKDITRQQSFKDATQLVPELTKFADMALMLEELETKHAEAFSNVTEAHRVVKQLLGNLRHIS